MNLWAIKNKLTGEYLRDLPNGKGKTYFQDSRYRIVLYNYEDNARRAFRQIFSSNDRDVANKWRLENNCIVEVELKEIES